MTDSATTQPEAISDPVASDFIARQHRHYEKSASDSRGMCSRVYHNRLEQVYRFAIGDNARVLEIGCGNGDLLASINPSNGIGIDFAPTILAQARDNHPDLTFIQADAHNFELPDAGPFDAIILSDLLDDLWDVQQVFEQIREYCTPRTRIIINTFSRVWQPMLTVARTLGMASPKIEQNWLAPDDIANLLDLTGFEVLRHWQEVLCPLPVPLVASVMNRVAVKTWPLRYLGMTNLFVARLKPQPAELKQNPVVSVIVPARNEAGNIEAIMDRTPHMGGGTEMIFVEGNSSDNTWQRIGEVVAANPDRNCQTMQQTGKGKGDAVRLAFSKATGDIVLILDADMTVPPEDLPRFVEALVSGTGEFINGVRLVYPMEGKAMRFINLLGNKFFSMAFSWLLDQPVKDTLCGTKVMWKDDYDRIAAGRDYFGDFDPFGDFDLIFGAAKLNMKIVDLPVRYRARTYGDTNINRWTGGWLLLRMTAFAARRLKFV